MLDKLVNVPFNIAGTGLALGVAGEAFDSPGLTEAGQTAVKFVKPAVAINMSGAVIKQLRDLDNDLQNRPKGKFFL